MSLKSRLPYPAKDLNENENQYPLGYFTGDRKDRWVTIREDMENFPNIINEVSEQSIIQSRSYV